MTILNIDHRNNRKFNTIMKILIVTRIKVIKVTTSIVIIQEEKKQPISTTRTNIKNNIVINTLLFLKP